MSNMSIISEATLTPGPSESVEDRLQITLKAAEQRFASASRKGRMYSRAVNGAALAFVFFGASAYVVAGATAGRTTNIATAVIGAAVSLVAFYLAIARGARQPETALLRMHELDSFIFDLKTVIRYHGRDAWTEFGPAPDLFKTKVAAYERQFMYDDPIGWWDMLGSRPDSSKDDGRGSGSAV